MEGDQWKLGQAMIYGPGHDGKALLFRSRVLIALLSAVLAACVFATARALAGELAGLSALLLYALDPLVIAHAGFATTDLGGAALYFLATIAIVAALERGGALRVAGAGLLLGAALAAKFSTLPLLAVVGAAAAWLVSRGEVSFSHALRRSAIVLLLGALVVIASYGPAGPALYVQGLSMLRVHGDVGHSAYAFGSYTDHGWWWFFPAAWAVKTPIPILAATVAGIALLARRARRGPAVILAMLVATALIAIAAMTSDLNLGVRHLLPMTPFLAVAGGMAAAAAGARGIVGRAVVAVGIAWLAIGTLRNHPDEMAYANEASGGPDRLWHHLADSSVDWGQDLPALAETVHRQPLRRLYLGYFGTADPAAYGLPYQWISSMRMVDRRYEDGPDRDGREWIAISVTNLREVYDARRESYAWLRERPFTAFPGHSIALFDITGDALAHRRIGEAAMRFGDEETAERPLRRAIEIAPQDGEARLDLARVLAAGNRFGEAREACVEAERLLPPLRTREVCDAIRKARG